MPDITYSVSLRVDKDYLSNSVNVGGATADMSQAGMKSVTLTVSTAATSISTANLSSVGVAFVRNLSTSTSSTVTIGIDAGGSFVGFNTLRAGEPAIYRLTPGTEYSVIGTSGSRVRVDITEG